jgi:hypothetical protein
MRCERRPAVGILLYFKKTDGKAGNDLLVSSWFCMVSKYVLSHSRLISNSSYTPDFSYTESHHKLHYSSDDCNGHKRLHFYHA